MRTPKVGDTVYYHPNTTHPTPFLAFVTVVHGMNNLVDLAVWENNHLVPKLSLHNRDSQQVKDSLQLQNRPVWSFREPEPEVEVAAQVEGETPATPPETQTDPEGSKKNKKS